MDEIRWFLQDSIQSSIYQIHNEAVSLQKYICFQWFGASSKWVAFGLQARVARAEMTYLFSKVTFGYNFWVSFGISLQTWRGSSKLTESIQEFHHIKSGREILERAKCDNSAGTPAVVPRNLEIEPKLSIC